MTSAKMMTSLFAALLAYATFQVITSYTQVSVAEIQDQECPTIECATALALPPSSSLFL